MAQELNCLLAEYTRKTEEKIKELEAKIEELQTDNAFLKDHIRRMEEGEF